MGLQVILAVTFAMLMSLQQVSGQFSFNVQTGINIGLQVGVAIGIVLTLVLGLTGIINLIKFKIIGKTARPEFNAQ